LKDWDEQRSDRVTAEKVIRPDRIKTGEYVGSILKRVLTDNQKKRSDRFFALCFLKDWDEKRSDRVTAEKVIRPDRIKTGEYVGSILKRVLTDNPKKRSDELQVLCFWTGQKKSQVDWRRTAKVISP
jgi:hypothetical protein